MFQFTTTNVINSDKDLTTGKDLWTTGEDSFTVKRVNTFYADNVVAVYKAPATEAELAKVTIDLTGLGTTGDTLRLALYIGLTQASQDSRYSNDMVLKGKPFTVDFVWKGTASDVAKKLAATIKKYDLYVYGEKLLKVSYKDSFITIEATTEYQRFKTVNIEKFDKDAYHGMGEYNAVKTLDDITEVESNEEVTDSAEAVFAGKEGFGTYSFLLHNLRLPTSARTRAFGVNQDETPIVGATYDQYTLHYCADRGPLGLNAVGDTVKSVTTHVFFVKSDLSKSFEEAIKTVAPSNEIIEVPEKKEKTSEE
jgi:hypothetical protein